MSSGAKPTFVFKRKAAPSSLQSNDNASSLLENDVTGMGKQRQVVIDASTAHVTVQDAKLPSISSSSRFDVHSLVETSLSLESVVHPGVSTSLLSPEEILKRSSDKLRLNSITSLDSVLKTQLLGYEASHGGYLTFVTLSLLEDTPEESRRHFFSNQLSETEIRSRYLLPTSMESTLVAIAQTSSGDDYLLEKLASDGVPSAEDVAMGCDVPSDPSRSSLRRLDEIYPVLNPKLDEVDLREMIRLNNHEEKVKSIKKRQRPADAPVPRYIPHSAAASTSSQSREMAHAMTSTHFEKPEMPSMLRGPASKKRRLYIQGCIPAVEYRFVDMEIHEDEESDLQTLRSDNGNRNWMLIAKREIPRVAPIHADNYRVKRENAAIIARAARDAVVARVEQVKSKAAQSQSKAKFLARSVYAFIKRNEKEWKRQAEREAEAARREEQEVVDKERTAKKLNFLITQTELYSHFMSKKLGIQAAEEEMEKLKTSTTTTGGVGGDSLLEAQLSSNAPILSPDDERQMKRAKEEALIAYKTQRAKIDSFDQQSAKFRGPSSSSSSSLQQQQQHVTQQPSSQAIQGHLGAQTASSSFSSASASSTTTTTTTAPHGGHHRRTGGIVTQNMPIASSNAADRQSSLIEQPRDLLCALKPYQVKGLNWLNNLYEQGINGILADEMGLGKTVQTIAMLGHLAETRGIWGPFIVIAPTSTLPNWVNEFAKFYPSFKVLPYYGTAKQRASLRKLLNPNYLHRPESVVHVLVTSYNLVVHDEKYISRIHWEYMVLDEAHAIKSASSVRSQTLLGFSNARNRLLLTGTPIQNNMAELWALLHFIMPTLFDSHNEFAEWFSKDIEEHAAGTASLNEHQLTRLHMILKPFMLRRVKVDVQNELPSKTEIQIRCEMTARQRTLYNGIRNHMSIHELFDRINVAQPTSSSSGASSSYSSSYLSKAAQERQAKTLMNIVMQFRNVCNHPEILERSETESPLQFAPPVPPVVSYGTIVASANRSWFEYQLPKIVYEHTMTSAELDPRRAGTEAEQTTRHKWLRHRFNVYSQLHIHSSIFQRRFESGEKAAQQHSSTLSSSSFSVNKVPNPSSSSYSSPTRTTKQNKPGEDVEAQMAVDSDAPPTPSAKRSFRAILSSLRGTGSAATESEAQQQQGLVATHSPSALSSSSPSSLLLPPTTAPTTANINHDAKKVFYREDDSQSHADLHCWDFVRLMDSCPSAVEWLAQASDFHRWMAILASRDRDCQISDMEHDFADSSSSSSSSSSSLLHIVPVSSPIALHKVDAYCAMNDLVRSDPLRRLMEDVNLIKLARGAYRPRVWSSPPSMYCNDRRFSFYQDQLEHDSFVVRLLLGVARHQSGPEDIFRQVSSVRLKRPSIPMARPLLDVFGSCFIQVPQYSELVRDSGKLKKLDELLKDFKRGGHRVLLYSQFTEVLDLLEDFMFVRGYKFVRLDGSSKLDDRRDMVDAFQTDPSLFIFLLSTRAGGLGINLTAADTVIFYDSDWNPTMDAQAMDRAHRLGQTRPVTVYRLITRNSIEERILQRAKQKGTIQNLVIQGGKFNLSPGEEEEMFKPAEMMELLLDDDQLQEINNAEAAKKKKTIINPIKMGMKRSAKPQTAKASSTPPPRTLTIDEHVSSSSTASSSTTTTTSSSSTAATTMTTTTSSTADSTPPTTTPHTVNSME